MDSTNVTVYFEGTANPIDELVTQIGLFATITRGVDLKFITNKDQYDPYPARFKISFDGCGVSNGLIGLLFADGLVSQCRLVEHHILTLLEYGHPKIILNAVGLSRGGIAVLYLAQMLGSVDRKRLEFNMLLFDPVPGNLISSSHYLDILGASTANTSLDLTKCCNIRDVLALYPYKPLPDLAFHAPSLPAYPPGCDVVEDACLGCHQGALFCSGNTPSRLSYLQISEWLAAHGVTVDITGERRYQTVQAVSKAPETLLDAMRNELQTLVKDGTEVVRHAHSTPAGGSIVCRAGSARFLNQYHKKLSLRLVGDQGGDAEQAESTAGFDHEFLLEVRRPSSGTILDSLRGCLPSASDRSAAYEAK